MRGGIYPRRLNRTKETVSSAKLFGWKTRIRRTMLAPVAIPPAPSSIEIRNFFFRGTCKDQTLFRHIISLVSKSPLSPPIGSMTYSGIGNTKITKSVVALIIVSVQKSSLWFIHVAFTFGFQSPSIGVQILILMTMTGK